MKHIYLKGLKMQEVSNGEVWEAGAREYFRVIYVVDIGNQTWVHYMRLRDNLEYSCLKESFTHRFRKVLVDERR
jgi:hypothetical protein